MVLIQKGEVLDLEIEPLEGRVGSHGVPSLSPRSLEGQSVQS